MRVLILSMAVFGLLLATSCEEAPTCVCASADEEVVETYTYNATTEEARQSCAAAEAVLNETDTLGLVFTCILQE